MESESSDKHLDWIPRKCVTWEQRIILPWRREVIGGSQCQKYLTWQNAVWWSNLICQKYLEGVCLFGKAGVLVKLYVRMKRVQSQILRTWKETNSRWMDRLWSNQPNTILVPFFDHGQGKHINFTLWPRLNSAKISENKLLMEDIIFWELTHINVMFMDRE